MTISVPDTLTSNTSGKYIASIRLRSGGLSFSGYIPSEKGTFFFRDIPLDNSVSYKAAFETLFYAHEFFTWSYRQINIIVDTPQFTLVPDNIYEEKRKESLLSFVFSTPQTKILSNAIEEEAMRLVFGMEEDVYTFCARSFLNPEFMHSLTSLLPEWKRASRISVPKQMHVIFKENRLDIVVYIQGTLDFANSFAAEKTEDFLYYILYVWKTCDLNQLGDQLFVHGNKEMYQSISHVLKLYLKNIVQEETV